MLLSADKTTVYIQDCIDKVKEHKQYLQLKEITANIRVDVNNSKKYLKKIMDLTKRPLEK